MSYRGLTPWPGELESTRRMQEAATRGTQALAEDLTDEDKKKGMLAVAKKHKGEGRPGVAKKIAKKAKSYFEARRARFVASMRNFSASTREVAPPGWEGTVKAMKKSPEVKNPWALAHSMKKKGMTPHK